jgi:hypothetical protein
MAKKKPRLNEVLRRRIETFFPSPFPDKVLNSAMECRGGYILQEVRPHWRKPGEVTKRPYAKLVFNASNGMWKVFWHRTNGDWNLLAGFKVFDHALDYIKSNPNGCFFG